MEMILVLDKAIEIIMGAYVLVGLGSLVLGLAIARRSKR